MHCPKCGSEAAMKNCFVKSAQRYKCKECGCQSLAQLPTASLQTKILAPVLYLSELSIEATDSIFGVKDNRL